MQEKEIVEFLQRVEGNYPVNKWMIQERHVWPLIKLIVCAELSSNTEVPNYEKNNKLKRILLEIKRRKAIFLFNKIENKNYDVLLYHHNIDRMLEMDDGTKFNVNIDPFTLMLEKEHKLLNFEKFNGSHNVETFRKSYNVDGYYYRALLCTKAERNIDEGSIFLEKYNDFLMECEERLRDKLKVKNIYRLISFMNKYSGFYRKILKNNKIKLLIAGCGYGIDTATIFMACKDVGVKCMEVQHGLAGGNGHRWYSSWSKMPLDGKRYEMLPDIYWCWTEKDKNCIDSWGGGLHTAYFGKRPIYSVLDKVETLTEKYCFSVEKKLPNILLTLQPDVNYPDWLPKVIQETSNDYNWIVRKHPNIDNHQRRFIEKVTGVPNVYIDGVAQMMLEKILMKVNLHITNHSAVTIEACNWGITTILLSREYEDVFKHQIDNGNVFIGDEKNILIKLIKENIMKQNMEIDTKKINAKNKDFLRRLL